MKVAIQAISTPGRSGAVLASALVVAAGGLVGCAVGDGASDGKTTVGVTLNAASNPFFLAEGKAIKEAARKKSLDVSVQYANADVSVQSDQIDTFIRKGVDSIVVDAVDSNGVGPAILRAKQAHIPVVAIDVAATGADSTITSDNEQAGREACTYLIKQLGGKGKMAVVDGSAVSAINDRMKGCKDAIKASPGIKIVATQRADLTRDKSMNVASSILTSHPDVDGFFGVNDPTAVGIALAAKQKRADVKIVGVDGAKQLTDLFDNGLVIGTSGQSPAQLGREGFDRAVTLANGEKPKSKLNVVPTFLVTPKTISDYESWG
ncbi:substrate-binding domain-containing protein [Streptomyces hygroscopicus]|uniref:substrate-binding domain-containing protein n=1 Tax=Streptomyces hygroscopicus TaxID=1912 RepID=UPI0036945D1A